MLSCRCALALEKFCALPRRRTPPSSTRVPFLHGFMSPGQQQRCLDSAKDVEDKHSRESLKDRTNTRSLFSLHAPSILILANRGLADLRGGWRNQQWGSKSEHEYWQHLPILGDKFLLLDDPDSGNYGVVRFHFRATYRPAIFILAQTVLQKHMPALGGGFRSLLTKTTTELSEFKGLCLCCFNRSLILSVHRYKAWGFPVRDFVQARGSLAQLSRLPSRAEGRQAPSRRRKCHYPVNRNFANRSRFGIYRPTDREGLIVAGSHCEAGYELVRTFVVPQAA